jgi:DNA-binding NarL/FixJ family response regulator
MSLCTVKHHIQSMKDKTGFRNRTELAVCARAKGLIINKLQSSE